jgi:hypothetical protein
MLPYPKIKEFDAMNLRYLAWLSVPVFALTLAACQNQGTEQADTLGTEPAPAHSAEQPQTSPQAEQPTDQAGQPQS